jgi:hypothetical protein
LTWPATDCQELLHIMTKPVITLGEKRAGLSELKCGRMRCKCLSNSRLSVSWGLLGYGGSQPEEADPGGLKILLTDCHGY